jgi:hypothetical protein
MTGGIMPKLLALRWPIGIGVGFLLVAGVWLSSGSSHGSRGTSPVSAISAFFTGDEYASELRELGFLREALERIEAELQQKTNGSALASLRTEQAAVMQRARQVASRVPVDRLPPDISRLIEPETAPAPAPAAAAAPSAARSIDEAAPAPIGQREAGRETSELRVGLAPPTPVTDITSLALDTRSPWLLFIGPKEPRRAAPAPSAASLNRAEMRASSAVPADRSETQPSSR